MKKTSLAIVFVFFAASAFAQSLSDQVSLANDALFQARVRQSMMFEAVNISGDGLSGGINTGRHALVRQIMNSPDFLKANFASAVATQPSIINAVTLTGSVAVTSGNADTQQALVTDAAINNSVLFVFNSFFGGQ